MKAAAFALALVSCLIAPLHAGDYKKDYADLKTRVTKEKMDEHLAAWRTREPQNPDAWILSANWALEQADQVIVSGKNGGVLPQGDYDIKLDGEKMVVVGKDGKPAGKIGSGTNATGARKAADFLAEALKKWPHRVDIHCGLATTYARAGLWKEQVESLAAFARAAREHAGKLRWCHEEVFESPEPEFVADKLHSFAMEHYRKETPDGDRRFLEIAKLIVEACPKSAKGYNDVAIGYALAKDWKAMQPILEKGVEVAPEDTIIWMNLGDNSVRLGKKDTARKAYDRVIELKPAQEMIDDARRKLVELDKKRG